MSYCSSATIAIRDGDRAFAVPLRCKRWTCQTCAPKRRARLIREAKDGNPTRFITLTVNPHELSSPQERGLALSRAWRDYVREFRRTHPGKALEYMVVLELTKRGEPHLHIMCRSPFIRQADLSKFMKARINAPIVDIRMVKGTGEVAKYVAKYISKRPIKLGTMKRYWRSMNYFSEAIKLMRRLRPKHNAVWRIELNTVAFIEHLKANGRLLWKDHFGRVCWRQYPWETAPPVTSNLVERLA